MKNLVIIGTSSTAETIFKFVQQHSIYNIIGFAVDEKYKIVNSFCGLPVYAIENLDNIINKNDDFLFIAMQWNNLNGDRKKVFNRLKANGYKFANVISPTAIINGSIQGENCWIADSAIIDYNSTIQDNVFIKVGAYIGPNTHINAHCFIGARSIIAGGVKIGAQSFIGLGSIVFDQVIVGEKCIVGAATALKRNLDSYSVYKTDINNFITKQYPENIIETKLQFKKNIR